MNKDTENMKSYVLKKFNFGNDINIPLYKETKNSNGWINYGSDNLMPDYYLGLLGRSPKHNAIIQTKQQLIAGNGWQKEGLDSMVLNFLKNPFGEADLDEIAARVAYDFEIFGAFALEIIWNKDRESIKAINHIPVNKVRAKIKDQDGNDDGYYVCNNWRKWSSTPIVYVPKFSTINRKEANQILYCKRYTPGAETYGIPGYMSAARWCELEYEISNFHLNAAKNGFTPGMRINIPFGMPNEDEIDREINRLRNEFEGTNNANAPVITFSDGDENKITFESMDQNSSDERFIQLNKEITEGIMTGHQVTSPTLFGVMQEGMMINKTATINDLQQFQAQYITPKQNFIEKVFTRLGNINGVGNIYLNRYELDFDVELGVSDLLSVIQSQIPDDQKKQVLISCGYRPEEANRLIEAGGETQVKNVMKKFKKWRSSPDSSNVDKILYNDETSEMVIKFNDGSYYTYSEISFDLFMDLVNKKARCITTGENEFGSWEVGDPSVGAGVHQYLINKGIIGVKGGSLK